MPGSSLNPILTAAAGVEGIYTGLIKGKGELSTGHTLSQFFLR